MGAAAAGVAPCVDGVCGCAAADVAARGCGGCSPPSESTPGQLVGAASGAALRSSTADSPTPEAVAQGLTGGVAGGDRSWGAWIPGQARLLRGSEVVSRGESAVLQSCCRP